MVGRQHDRHWQQKTSQESSMRFLGAGGKMGFGGGAKGDPWTPSNLSGSLDVWVDASSITGLSNNDQLDTWTNLGLLSNFNRDETNSTSEYPRYVTNVLNNLPGIEFPSSSGTRMFGPTISSGNTTKSRIACAVWKTGKLSGAAQIINRTGYVEINIGRTANKTNIGWWNGSFTSTVGTTTISTSNSYMTTGVWNKSAGERTIFVNGNQEAQTTGLTTTWTYNNNQTTIIGNNAYNFPPGQYFQGFLFEAIIYLSDTYDSVEREKIEGYLAHKWGLTSDLPSDHPYKNNPPTV